MAKNEKPRVLLDSCALLTILKNEPGADRLDGLLEMIDDGDAELVASVITLGEVFKKSDAPNEAERRRQDDKLQHIRQLLESPKVLLLDVTKPIVEKATGYRINRKPKHLADAIHLATAVLNKCDWFVTFDDDFPDVDELRVFRRAQLEDPAAKLPWTMGRQDALPFEGGNVIPLHRPGQ